MQKIYFFIVSVLISLTCSAIEAIDSTFVIQGAKGRLVTHLQLPAVKVSKIPVVIVCHGLTGNQNEKFLSTIANNLLKRNMGVVRFDFNGHGQSEGELVDMNVLNEMQDLRNVVAWIEKQPFTKNLSLVGHSLGGIVVGMIAPEMGKDGIKSLVLIASGGVAPDLMLMGRLGQATFDPWNIPDYITIRPGKNIGGSYIETMRDLPIYQEARKYTGPTYIIHGTHDQAVPYTYSQRYDEVMPNSQLELIDGENHLFTLTNDASADKIAQWLKNQQ